MSHDFNRWHSSEDLPTRTIDVLPYGHPCLEKVLYLGKPQDRTFRSLEGIFELIVITDFAMMHCCE